jgi:RNA 2',3'-cyclic 3'-phosphodiesterase
MRLFVAADLPNDARELIAAEQERLAAVVGGSAGSLRWVKPDHAHLTLVFLGDVADAQAPAVIEAIGRDVPVAPFALTFQAIGAFPPRGAPRVLWLGVGAGGDALAALQREVARRVSELGVPLEARAFHPHLTLARWRESRPIDRERALEAGHRNVIARAEVTGATLYQSRLSPAGPRYTALAHMRLRQ